MRTIAVSAAIAALCPLWLASVATGATQASASVFSIAYGRYSAEELRLLAERFALIVLEPYFYPNAPPVLKQVNPEVKVLFYMNTFDASPKTPDGAAGRSWKVMDRHLDWFLRDVRGERISVYLHRSTDRYGMNLGDPGYQAYLAEQARAYVDQGYDGVFLDNVFTWFPYADRNFTASVPPGMTPEQWVSDTVAMLKAIKAKLGTRLVVFNQVRSGEPGSSLAYAAVSDGAMDEHWLINSGKIAGYDPPWGWKGQVDLLQKLNKLGKITLPVTTSSRHNRQHFLFGLASYLLVKEGTHAYFSYAEVYKVTSWFSEYELDLGAAKGDYGERNGLFVREYARGLVAVNPFPTERVLPIRGRYFRPDGVAATGQLKLEGYSGTILLSDKTALRGLKLESDHFAAGVPLDLVGRPPQEKEAVIALSDELERATSASLVLTLWDADNPGEGAMLINDMGPIPLPTGRGPLYNGRSAAFDPIPLEKAWLKKGENRIRFVHKATAGYRVDSAVIRLTIQLGEGEMSGRMLTERDYVSLGRPLTLTDGWVFSSPREGAMTVKLPVDPTRALSASLVLTLWDADNPGEGDFYVNGYGPIPLPTGIGKEYNNKTRLFPPIPIDRRWLRQGENQIRFVHLKTAGFRVESVTIRLKELVPDDGR